MPVRHPDLYLFDGNVVFLVGSVLFCTYRGLLALHFDLFKNVWVHSKGLIAEHEGMDDEHPIVLDERTICDASEFAAVLKFVLHSVPHGTQPHTLFELIALLKIGRQWMSPTIANWSISQLDERFDELGPGLALKLSSDYRTFSVPGITWISRSVRTILARGHARLISMKERDQMGADAYAILVHTLEIMEEKLKTLAAQAPGVTIGPSYPCDIMEHSECRQLYGDFWWNTIARKLLLPRPLPLEGPNGATVLGLNKRIPFSREGFAQVSLLIESEIRVREHPPNPRRRPTRGISHGCRTAFLNETSRFFDVPERVISTAVTGIQTLYANDTMQIDD